MQPFFCRDCSTRKHKDPLKGHEVKDVDEWVAPEGTEVQQLEAQLKELSEKAKFAATANDAIDEKSRQELTRFVSEIIRSLSTGRSAREAQQLHGIHRKCIALLQHSSAARLDVDPHENPIGALVAYRNLSARITEYMEKTRESVKNAEIMRDFDIPEIILKTILSLMGNAESDGVSIV